MASLRGDTFNEAVPQTPICGNPWESDDFRGIFLSGTGVITKLLRKSVFYLTRLTKNKKNLILCSVEEDQRKNLFN